MKKIFLGLLILASANAMGQKTVEEIEIERTEGTIPKTFDKRIGSQAAIDTLADMVVPIQFTKIKSISVDVQRRHEKQKAEEMIYDKQKGGHDISNSYDIDAYREMLRKRVDSRSQSKN